MRVAFKLRPLQLDVQHDGARRRPEGMKPWHGRYWLGDSLYRAASRRVIGELLAENRRLRHGQPKTSTTLVVQAFDAWLRRRYPPPPPERSYD